MKTHSLKVLNTLSGEKEKFEPMNAPFVGMYVCGPTVYGHAHLGHARSAISFDLVFRYLTHLGYKVRYVRNITDVGHLVGDADEGEDKIGRLAKLQQLEPMEVAQYYTNSYRRDMGDLNIRKPSIEPLASGHIMEQMEIVQDILSKGLAYEVNGSVYFDTVAYNKQKHYGILSGRKIDELLEATRELDNQDEKRNSVDFALWKKASPEHIMRWKSPWGDGFPGWHLECSAMSSKYLGTQFDIHGGGMDLMFPHHECEIAQHEAHCNVSPAKYWLHNNMITIEGKKMGKSLGNTISVRELFEGNHPLLKNAYSPMTVRFFVLQSHYRSTLDFSNEALTAAKKGYNKLTNAYKFLKSLGYPENAEESLAEKHIAEIEASVREAYEGLDDDFNSAKAIAAMFNMVKKISMIQLNQLSITQLGSTNFELLKSTFIALYEEVLGLQEEKPAALDALFELALSEYAAAKANKDYSKVDVIRARFKEMGLALRDGKNGISWAYEE